MTTDNENLQFQIRQGLHQYIGAMLNNSNFTTKENRQLVVATLCEEAIKIITNDDSKDSVEDIFFIDDYACKPFLRGMKFLLSRNLKRMKNEIPNDMPEVLKTMEQIEAFCSKFDKNILDAWIAKGEDA